MNFKEAFDAAYDAEAEKCKKEGKNFAVNSSTLRILAFMWNMIVIAENKLDNLVIIAKDNSIHDIPLTGDKGKTSKPSTGKKTADKKIEGPDDPKAKTEGPKD